MHCNRQLRTCTGDQRGPRTLTPSGAPEGLAHYVEEYGVRLPDEVVTVAARGAAPFVDSERFTRALLETGELSIDVDWWYSLAGVGSTGPAITHLSGCRRSGSTASWHLPTIADIYVDRVPPGAVAIMVQLRPLLGAPWPFSGLRDLLASQPFLAAAGNPSRLYLTLTSLSELRPYLFYGTERGLMPVWPDT